MNLGGKQKIIIYGGTFDPPHKGHFALIKASLAALDPALLYIVPGLRSPFKDFPCAPFRERAAMLAAGLGAAGLGGDARIKIHPYEFERGRLTYTWRTVSFFRRKYPRAEIYFLMGSDCLETFHLWKNYRKILASARLIVGARAGFPLKNPRGLNYIRLKGCFPFIASTALKIGLFAGFRPSGLFDATENRIAARGLYFAALRRRIAGLMTPARFKHTRAATLLSLQLAVKYGADLPKTALTGLLHDIARDLGPRGLAAYAKKARFKVPALEETLKKAPILLHSYAGAELAEKKFGVKDKAVLNAIRRHTLGSVSPGLLAKIIYVADLAADGRDFSGAGMVKQLAFADLDAAYAAAIYVKLVYALKAGGWMHPESVKVWNNLLEKNNC
jgi:nicotinate-nucleotide adenylyltransferase